MKKLLDISLKEKIFRLPKASYLPKDFFLLDLDDPVWFLLDQYFVVDARVEELGFVLTHPDYNTTRESDGKIYPTTIWGHVYPEGIQLLANTSSETFEFKSLAAEIISGCTICNQEVWIDLPVGHAVFLNDEIYLNEDKALCQVIPRRARKRHKTSALNWYLRDHMQWLASNHHKTFSQMDFPTYRKYPERKVLYRKKH